jgi:hypothetical protein
MLPGLRQRTGHLTLMEPSDGESTPTAPLPDQTAASTIKDARRDDCALMHGYGMVWTSAKPKKRHRGFIRNA